MFKFSSIFFCSNCFSNHIHFITLYIQTLRVSLRNAKVFVLYRIFTCCWFRCCCFCCCVVDVVVAGIITSSIWFPCTNSLITFNPAIVNQKNVFKFSMVFVLFVDIFYFYFYFFVFIFLLL